MTRYAFMIGCEKYSNFANIAFCEGDVILIQETLVKYCDYEYKNMERVFQYAVYDAQRSPFCFRTAVFRSQRPPIFS